MTPNIFEKIVYHLKTIIHCLSPKSFYSRRQSFSNQLEVMSNNYYSAKGFQNTYMYGMREEQVT